MTVDLSAVPDMEYTALIMLTDGEEQVREAGTVIALVAMNPYVRR
jgi:anti-anti-sigma regulatory factor